MGVMDWFSGESKSENAASDSIVRYLCSVDREYEDMDKFLEDFYDIVEQTIEQYNQNNPVRAEQLDREDAYKAGGRWIYEADIQQLNEEGEEIEEASGSYLTRKSTFKVIAREQPDFEIELSGTESLISPFLNEMEKVLDSKAIAHEIVTIAKPGLGKAKGTETEPAT